MSKRPTDIVLDLETLGRRSDAAIIAIGAATLNRDTGAIGPTYYTAVKIDSALRFGRVTGGTLKFWLSDEVSTAARRVFFEDGVDLYDALRDLNNFIRSHAVAGACVWGNGSHFDVSTLEHAFDAIARPGFCEQWDFWAVRDLRTAIDLKGIDKHAIPFVGVPHHARDDAIHQAKILAACFGKVGVVANAPSADEGGDW